MKSLQVVLARRPQGWVQESDFAFEEVETPDLGAGDVLVRNRFLSLDPYMRGRMDDVKSYAPCVPLGAVMVGAAVGEVLDSKSSRFKPGDWVVGMPGWREASVVAEKELRKADTSRIPPSAYLGAVGMPGVTAWIGMLDIGKPKSGETVVVSAAAGAVGGVAGQLAQRRGARVVGIAGGPRKCDYVKSELGFDACLDYKAPEFREELKKATPHGVDVYFENVGGDVADAVFGRLNTFARVPLCGLVSQYNNKAPRPGPDMRLFLIRRIHLEGFIVSDRTDRWPEAFAELGSLVEAGQLKYRETIAEGLREAPRAFIGMLKGENVGKQLVRL